MEILTRTETGITVHFDSKFWRHYWRLLTTKIHSRRNFRNRFADLRTNHLPYKRTFQSIHGKYVTYPSRRHSRLFNSAKLEAAGIMASGDVWWSCWWCTAVFTWCWTASRRPWTKWCCSEVEDDEEEDEMWCRRWLLPLLAASETASFKSPYEAASKEAPWSWPENWGLRLCIRKKGSPQSGHVSFSFSSLENKVCGRNL